MYSFQNFGFARYLYILLQVTVFLNGLPCSSQKTAEPEHILPFEFKNNTIYLNLKVNNKDVVFYFDTGATTTVLDKNIAHSLGVKPNDKVDVSGGGGSKSYELSTNEILSIGSDTFKNIPIILEDLSRLRDAAEFPFDGIIGLPLLENYVTHIDWNSMSMILYDKKSSLKLPDFKEYDIRFLNGIKIPSFPIDFELEDGSIFSGETLFDSGADLAFMVNTPFSKKNLIKNKVDKVFSVEANYMGTKSTSEKIRIKSLNFLGFSFSNLPISLSTSQKGVTAMKQYMGILGAEIIYRFDIIMDYYNNKLYLKPSFKFTKPFEFPMVGFKLKENQNGKIIIKSISESCESYQKGLRTGDILTAINNKEFKNVDEYRKLLKQEGKNVVLTIIQNNISKKIKTTLKKQF